MASDELKGRREGGMEGDTEIERERPQLTGPMIVACQWNYWENHVSQVDSQSIDVTATQSLAGQV